MKTAKWLSWLSYWDGLRPMSLVEQKQAVRLS